MPKYLYPSLVYSVCASVELAVKSAEICGILETRRPWGCNDLSTAKALRGIYISLVS